MKKAEHLTEEQFNRYRHRTLAPAELLDVDREYREAARAGLLPTIAPRRFNSEKKAWQACTPNEATGITPRCFQTPPVPIG